MRAAIATLLLLAACRCPTQLQPSACELAEDYASHLQADVNWCKTNNCVAWHVQREIAQRAACAGLPAGVSQ